MKSFHRISGIAAKLIWYNIIGLQSVFYFLKSWSIKKSGSETVSLSEGNNWEASFATKKAMIKAEKVKNRNFTSKLSVRIKL